VWSGRSNCVQCVCGVWCVSVVNRGAVCPVNCGPKGPMQCVLSRQCGPVWGGPVGTAGSVAVCVVCVVCGWARSGGVEDQVNNRCGPTSGRNQVLQVCGPTGVVQAVCEMCKINCTCVWAQPSSSQVQAPPSPPPPVISSSSSSFFFCFLNEHFSSIYFYHFTCFIYFIFHLFVFLLFFPFSLVLSFHFLPYIWHHSSFFLLFFIENFLPST